MPSHIKKGTKIAIGVAICTIASLSVGYIVNRHHQMHKLEQELQEAQQRPAYGPLPIDNALFCDMFQGEFYSNLCHETIDVYDKTQHVVEHYESGSHSPVVNIHNPNINFTDNQIQFGNDLKFAAETCCKSLKPDESDKNENYCDAQSDNGERASGCETYRECIKSKILQPDIKDCEQNGLKETSDDNHVKPSMDEINH